MDEQKWSNNAMPVLDDTADLHRLAPCFKQPGGASQQLLRLLKILRDI